MRKRFEEIGRLVHEGAVGISEHAYDELSADGILAREVVEGVAVAVSAPSTEQKRFYRVMVVE